MFEQRTAWQKFGRLPAEYLAVGLEERLASLLLLSPKGERSRELLASGKAKTLARMPPHYIASYLSLTPMSLSRSQTTPSWRRGAAFLSFVIVWGGLKAGILHCQFLLNSLRT